MSLKNILHEILHEETKEDIDKELLDLKIEKEKINQKMEELRKRRSELKEE